MTTTATKTTDADPREVLADLEQRVLDGDTNVTASALAKARQAVELADLHDQAADRQQEAAAAAERERAIESLRADIEAHRVDLSSAQKAYEALVETLRTFTHRIDEWKVQREQLVARARVLATVDDAEALPSLAGDWLATARLEADGQPSLSQRRVRVGTLGMYPFKAHALHSDEHAARLRAEVDAKNAATAERHRIRNERQREERAQAKAEDAAAIERARRLMPGYPE